MRDFDLDVNVCEGFGFKCGEGERTGCGVSNPAVEIGRLSRHDHLRINEVDQLVCKKNAKVTPRGTAVWSFFFRLGELISRGFANTPYTDNYVLVQKLSFVYRHRGIASDAGQKSTSEADSIERGLKVATLSGFWKRWYPVRVKILVYVMLALNDSGLG